MVNVKENFEALNAERPLGLRLGVTKKGWLGIAHGGLHKFLKQPHDNVENLFFSIIKYFYETSSKDFNPCPAWTSFTLYLLRRPSISGYKADLRYRTN